MDDRCTYCSGYGAVPATGTGDTHRVPCPKCEGTRRIRTVMLGKTFFDYEALRDLLEGQRRMGIFVDEMRGLLNEVPDPVLEPERPPNRTMRREKRHGRGRS